MKIFKLDIIQVVAVLALAGAFASCKKDGNPNNLPDVSPDEFVGKVDGYTTSDSIFSANLIAYWPFEDKTEKLSGTAPTQTLNDAIVDGGVKGKALSLNGGFLYYATQFPKFKTDVFTSFTISVWLKILNNGSKRTMVFQLARPGIFTGNINFMLNTQSFPASDISNLKINPTFTTIGGGTQDNLNNQNGTFPYVTPTIGMTNWVNLVLTYNGATGVFDIWSNGIKAGAYPNRGVGNSLFKSWEPNEVIIGSNYNSIPGKSVSADASFAPMTGQMDELRIFNRALPDAHIKALYNLGKAGL